MAGSNEKYDVYHVILMSPALPAHVRKKTHANAGPLGNEYYNGTSNIQNAKTNIQSGIFNIQNGKTNIQSGIFIIQNGKLNI